MGGRKQLPCVVLRWEWQRRVIIDPAWLKETLSKMYSHLKGERRRDAMHARYLHDLFVRRTRFDNSDKDRHNHFMNILQVRLPGRLAV